MNKAILVGRLTRDPEIHYPQGENSVMVAKFVLAVDRRFKKDCEPSADFIPCVEFGKNAEFAEKYFRQGMRISISGRIQTGSYTNKDGAKVYTTQVYVEEQEFAQSRDEFQKEQHQQPAAGTNQNTGSSQPAPAGQAPAPSSTGQAQAPTSQGSQRSFDFNDGFMNIPDGIDEELPFR